MKMSFATAACILLLTITPASAQDTAARDNATQVLVVVGPSDHAPGTHEVAAGGKLIKHCLESITNSTPINAHVVDQWPSDESFLQSIDTVVFIGDSFPLMRMPESDATLSSAARMMQRGCGIVCVHYATGLRAEDVAADGSHPLLDWMGGYFATKCTHHQSIARIFTAATIAPSSPEHPICRGWGEFTLHDEPYINNYFGPNENRPAANVVILATSMLPPESPQPQAVAWCVQRPDGGRGFGIVMPHFYRNWQREELRRVILNGIVWSAKLDVPATGVDSVVLDLTQFEPGSVQPQSRTKAVAK